jgi:hypothetical protein
VLDLPAISAKLAVINAAAVGLMPKTLNTPASLCERLRLCYKGRRGDT